MTNTYLEAGAADQTSALKAAGLGSAPSEQESALARESSRRLASLLGARASTQVPGEAVSVRIGDENEPHEVVALPVSVLQMLTRLLAHMAEGHAVQLLPVDAELSTFEAADVLSVSRPYLIKLLDEGAIAFRRVGTHRRVLLRDLLDYKRADDQKRQALLAELAAEAQELGLGY